MHQPSYARCRDLELAYVVIGEGPMDVVVAPSFVSHLDLTWGTPAVKAWVDELTSFARVVLFDKAGTGLSDPVPGIPTLEERADEIEAVMDAAGVERAALFGLSEGGPSSILFAATRPERVQALVLFGTFPSGRWIGGTGEALGLTPEQIERGQAFLEAAMTRWGDGEALTRLIPHQGSRMQLALLERMSASPGMARAAIESARRLDVSHVLSSVGCPALVVHARDDLVPVQAGRYLAEHLPDARILEVEGHDHAPWLSEPGRVAEAVREFLTGRRHAHRGDRVLATVLFTDMVASTERAAEAGDQRWRAVLERHDELTRDLVEQFGGRLIKSTGDGALATFDGPARGIRCAERLIEEMSSAGIELRAGLHAGECELLGDDVGGMAVHIAARVSALAGPGEVLVSRTVADLVVGSGLQFSPRGAQELKGVPGVWEILAVGEGTDPLASLQTPAPQPRAFDRMAGVAARRTPAIARTAARLGRGRAKKS